MNKLIWTSLCWYVLFAFPYPVNNQNGIDRKHSFSSSLPYKASSKKSLDSNSNIVVTGNPSSSINQMDLELKSENTDCSGNSFQKLIYSKERYMICSTFYQTRGGSIIMAGIGGSYKDLQQDKRTGVIVKLDED